MDVEFKQKQQDLGDKLLDKLPAVIPLVWLFFYLENFFSFLVCFFFKFY